MYMYGLKVKHSSLSLEDIPCEYQTLLSSYKASAYEAFKNGKSLGNFLVAYNGKNTAYVYLSEAIKALPVQERLALQVLVEE